jgi:2-polyprenyl-6-methoxyphenol hydroxylase-like FAD-dependent oxidoreductase
MAEPGGWGDGRGAVVIGSGMAGLTAARVLAEYFPRVTIVERDTLPATATFRPGVPQSRHVHALFVQGRLLLDRLFPGLGQELMAAGAIPLEWPADILWHNPAGWGGRFRSGLVTYSCSRELLECSIRRRLEAHPKISVLEGYGVVGLSADAGRTRIDGVCLRPRGQQAEPADDERVLRGRLVVDASGRESRAPTWLADLGLPGPSETVVNSFLGYATRYYARPPGAASSWKGIVVQRQHPHGTRSGVLMPLEDDRWIVTLAGAARDYPPHDAEGFLQFARSLNHPIIYEQVRDLTPVSPGWSYRRTENRLRHYDQLPRRAEGFIVLGDAACAFNPVYGQGMTVAALGARTLARCLKQQHTLATNGDLSGLAKRFQVALARTLTLPWLMATGEDFRYPVTQGPRPGRMSRLSHWYFDRLIATAVSDAVVHRTFLEVIHLVRSPLALVDPSIVLRVLRR